MKISTISAMEALTLLQKGWKGYLICTMDTKKVPQPRGDTNCEEVFRDIPEGVEWVATLARSRICNKVESKHDSHIKSSILDGS